jgi:hypothetical protein
MALSGEPIVRQHASIGPLTPLQAEEVKHYLWQQLLMEDIQRWDLTQQSHDRLIVVSRNLPPRGQETPTPWKQDLQAVGTQGVRREDWLHQEVTISGASRGTMKRLNNWQQAAAASIQFKNRLFSMQR